MERVSATPMAQASQASKAEVAQWRAVVQACVPALVAAWEPIMGVKAGQLAYRNMTSRWGSCQPSTGRICINVRLALYPPECLEYVVVHELCHLLERGHGPRFHQLMDRFMPDWKQRRDKLRVGVPLPCAGGLRETGGLGVRSEEGLRLPKLIS